MTRLAIEFSWDLLGVAATDAAGRLVMPAAPPLPGLYRFWAETGPGHPWVFVGETADLQRRLTQVARPAGGPGAEGRVTKRLLDLLDAGARVMVWTITEAWTRVDEGDPVPLDLRHQSSRLIVEDAAMLAAGTEGVAGVGPHP